MDKSCGRPIDPAILDSIAIDITIPITPLSEGPKSFATIIPKKNEQIVLTNAPEMYIFRLFKKDILPFNSNPLKCHNNFLNTVNCLTHIDHSLRSTFCFGSIYFRSKSIDFSLQNPRMTSTPRSTIQSWATQRIAAS